jgi:hypothetical protein
MATAYARCIATHWKACRRGCGTSGGHSAG